MIVLKEKPSAIPAAEGFENTVKIYESEIITKPCLCGQEFLPSQVCVMIESPIVTIARVCATCSTTLASGSFAERGELARHLLAQVNGGAA